MVVSGARFGETWLRGYAVPGNLGMKRRVEPNEISGTTTYFQYVVFPQNL
jgi:hypothetical protein